MLKFIRFNFLLAFCTVLGHSCGPLQSSDHFHDDTGPVLQLNPWLERLTEEYHTYLESIAADSLLPGFAAGIVYRDQVIHRHGYGYRHADSREPVDVHTVFRIGSLSKGFTAVLAGMMVREGLMNWEDPVIQYIPDFSLKSKRATESVTLRHLLSHTTTLPPHAYTDLIEDGWDLASMIEALRDVDLSGLPGEVYAYQNVAFSLAGEMMVACTGYGFGSLLEERVFLPLNMDDASIGLEALMRNVNKAHPHWKKGSGWTAKKILNEYYNTSPAGGINASISDMCHWLLAMNGERPEVVSRDLLDTLFTPIIRTPIRARYRAQWQGLGELWYGLGWRIFERGSHRIIYHGGLVNSYRSEIALNPANGLGVCVLMNASASVASEVVPVFLGLCDQYADSIATWEQERMFF